MSEKPAPNPWRATATTSDIARWLSQESARGAAFVVVTHGKPDGDAVGSSMGLVRALNRLRPGSARAIYFGPLPTWIHAMTADAPWATAESADGAALLAATNDHWPVVVDTGSWQQLDGVAAFLRRHAERSCLVDHHRQGDEDVSTRRCLEPTAAACQLVARIASGLLGVPQPRQLPLDVAQSVYLGLATDTGWFRHSNVDADVMLLAAELIQAGVRPATLYQTIEQLEKPTRLALLARALASLELVAGAKAALLTLTQRDFRETGADQGESGGFVDFPQTISTVKVAVLLTETIEKGANVVKLSFRSKADAQGKAIVNVNLLAQEFGGGGHDAAAGARAVGSLSDVRDRVVKALDARLGIGLETSLQARSA
ncbi:MAG: DHH family phosphoesterase [Planctomycetota bacterium]|nr:DHH family phosphoesterase [Planctomycetota bacterium]